MVLYEMVNGYKSYVKSKEVQFANPNLSEGKWIAQLSSLQNVVVL